MTEEDPPLLPDLEEQEPQPPKEEIRIVEMSEVSGTPNEMVCKMCKVSKPVHVEVESEGIIEYVCKECFKVDVADQGKSCFDCESPLKQDDEFCGKCGSPTVKKCSECGTAGKDGDAFCGKCGNTL